MPRISFQQQARAAAKHLQQHPPFPPLIEQFGLCRLTPDTDLFAVLARSIIAQLISTQAARTIQRRFEALFADGRVTPASVKGLSLEQLRGCGLSRAKAEAILGLARHYEAVPDFTEQVLKADDELAHKLLLPLKGIGPWTVDMVLMFGLGRPDVLPVGDLGLRAAVQEQLKLDTLPDAKKLLEVAQPWQPFRTFATWYLWRSRGWVPQSS